MDKRVSDYGPLNQSIITITKYRATIDYSKFLKEMIEAENYYYVHPDITAKNFSIEKQYRRKKVTVQLIHFDQYLTSDEAVVEIKKRGLRPARIEELIALGVAHPTLLQREFTIVALGSSCRDDDGLRHVPCLHGRASGGRNLDLFRRYDEWEPDDRFAAVRRS